MTFFWLGFATGDSEGPRSISNRASAVQAKLPNDGVGKRNLDEFRRTRDTRGNQRVCTWVAPAHIPDQTPEPIGFSEWRNWISRRGSLSARTARHISSLVAAEVRESCGMRRHWPATQHVSGRNSAGSPCPHQGGIHGDACGRGRPAALARLPRRNRPSICAINWSSFICRWSNTTPNASGRGCPKASISTT